MSIGWILFTIFAYTATFVMAIIIHEIGHIIYFHEVLKRDVTIKLTKTNLKIAGIKTPWPAYDIKTGQPQDYEGLTRRQYYNVALAGIAAGFIPIILAGLFYDYRVLWLGLAYFVGCQKDIMIMLKQVMNNGLV